MGSQCFTLRVGAAAATTHRRLPAGWGGGRKREGQRGNARNCLGQRAGRRHHAQAQPRGAPRHHLAERGRGLVVGGGQPEQLENSNAKALLRSLAR